MTQDNRTMPVNQAQKYMNELRAREVPYSFQLLSHGLVTVSTSGVFFRVSSNCLRRAEIPEAVTVKRAKAVRKDRQ